MTESYKQNKISYIKSYNKSHYSSINVMFRKSDPKEAAMLDYLRSKTSTTSYIKELVLKDMLKNKVSLEYKYSFSEEEYENMSVEKADELIDQYFDLFGTMPMVIYPTSIYSPVYLKLIVRSLNSGKPYSEEDIHYETEDIII